MAAAAASSKRSNPNLLPLSSPFQPFPNSPSSSPFASSSTAYYSPSPSHTFFNQSPRSPSPTPSPPPPPPASISMLSPPPPPAPSVRFSIHTSISPRPSHPPHHLFPTTKPKRTCLCSPTTHPGSFRCALHKNTSPIHSIPYSPNRLNIRRSAMTNSLVRIGTVEGDLVKRALAALIRPSSHHQRRRADFHPRPTRLSIMSKAEDL